MILDFEAPQIPGFKAAYLADETASVMALLPLAKCSPSVQAAISARAENLVKQIRSTPKNKNGLEAFLQEYDLSSEEGIALMCLAEALLRVPDTRTIDELIRDKLAAPQWEAKLGQSDSLLVNASTFALMLTGKVLSSSETRNLKSVFKTLLRKSGEPFIRQAVSQAMKILGRQFVMGRTMAEALKRAKENEAKGYLYSYDMLGEAARTEEDAERYFKAYEQAIEDIGRSATANTPQKNPGISVKLSALHPRYVASHFKDVVETVAPKLLQLAKKAKEYRIGLTVDAEEARVLELSLAIIEKVFADPSLADFEGFGLAVQSYQKRALYLIDWLQALAHKHKKRWMIRLIKGAYWDSEIKYAQVMGLAGYPVFTRKSSTDVSFIACAKKILAAPSAFYAQFGSHNAYSVSVILELAKGRTDFEFQCLHGMGQTLYDLVVKDHQIPCRIYAPVGSHRELLAYLVRRLLENGANTSFVNRIADDAAPIAELIRDPIGKTEALIHKPHPKIPLPRMLYGEHRLNALGVDTANYYVLSELDSEFSKIRKTHFRGGPLIDGKLYRKNPRAVVAPFDYRVKIGDTTEAELAHIEMALSSTKTAEFSWQHTEVKMRAAILKRAADLFESRMPEFLYLAIFEAGKTLPDAVAEVREAIDFCRYYANLAEAQFAPVVLPGPTGEFNQLTLRGRGTFVCISPWNFPLAIFVGQVTAALVAGNAVIAKPAEQTTLMATAAVKLLHEAGVPNNVLQLLPGKGEIIGANVVQDPRVDGVIFTGSTETAKAIQLSLAKRVGAIVPFIAETGGQNVMIVDSTALLEQVIDDVLVSAFGSAGQRCSALRVLYVQEEIADHFIALLKGAMASLKVGSPTLISTDVGPVIDAAALEMLQAHKAWLDTFGIEIATVQPSENLGRGTYFLPCAYEIRHISELSKEVFGPCLHVIRFKVCDLEKIITEVNHTGFGLTQGLHTRMDSRVQWLGERSSAGNLYVNRNMVGAVVGVQPFGGQGLSGTGPKAGGPHYLLRLVVEQTVTVNTTASGGNASLLALQEGD